MRVLVLHNEIEPEAPPDDLDGGRLAVDLAALRGGAAMTDATTCAAMADASDPRGERARAWFRGYLVYQTLISVALWYPIWAVAMLDRGFDLIDISVASMVFSVAALVLEIPTGVVADRFGHKLSVVLGCIMVAGAVAVFVAADTMPLILLAWILWALGQALDSGAEAAYLWEATRGSDDAQRFQRVSGRSQSVGMIAAALGSGVAGFLYEVSPDLPFLLDVALLLAGAVVLAMLREPRAKTVRPAKPPPSSEPARRSMVRAAAGDLARWPVMRIALLLAASYMATGSAFVLAQPLMVAAGLAPSLIGLVFTGLLLVGAWGSWRAAGVSAEGTGLRSVLGTVLAVSLMALPQATAPAFALGYFIAWQHRTHLTPQLQRLLTSATRATALSLVALGTGLMVAAASAVAGVVGERVDPSSALVTTSCMAATPLVVVVAVDRLQGARHDARPCQSRRAS